MTGHNILVGALLFSKKYRLTKDSWYGILYTGEGVSYGYKFLQWL
jgi:hypothetical protein